VLAFALQDTFGNLASGVILMLVRPFDIGDYVVIGGTVVSVSTAATTISTPDNQEVVIPNSQVWGSVIVNASANSIRRVDLVFDVSYDSDLPTVIGILRDIVDANPLTPQMPETSIEIDELAENSIKILCRPWVRTPDYWRLRWDLLAAAKARFDAEGPTRSPVRLSELAP
jgi:small conductance mechanosensitive channel